MIRLETVEQSLGLKALSVVVAVLIWTCVAAERRDEATLAVPVSLEQVPAGLVVVEPPPKRVELRVSGPRILLWKISLVPPTCRLDLSAAAPGKVSFPATEGTLGLDRELKVVKAYPASLDLVLAAPRR